MVTTTLPPRRRSTYAAYLCAFISAILLLLSVSLLYSRLSLSPSPSPYLLHNSHSQTNDEDLNDPIDEFDIIDDQQQQQIDDYALHQLSAHYFFDPLTSSIRSSFKSPPYIRESRSADVDGYNSAVKLILGSSAEDSRSKSAFASDDIPVDDDVRRKSVEVRGIEDALLLNDSPLREMWGDWFDKKSTFLRKDRMFRSNFDVLNPLHNPMLQDPDAIGVTGFTRGDRIVQKWWLHEFKRVPFRSKKKVSSNKGNVDSTTVPVIAAERRTLKDSYVSKKNTVSGGLKLMSETRNEIRDHIYADDNTWGYYPGLPLHLRFKEFMDAFFRLNKCRMRVFMVWNSPPWMFSVRHQRGIESLLSHHPDACVVVFSETIELDFFKDNFVKDGYKVAVVMPNLDELLKGTPAHIFTSVWFEWRKTKFYSTHHSELVRLAALYMYGGIYLDSDIIVLKPISVLNNSVAMEDHVAGSALNGAVMAFQRHSPFIKECLEEFYATYDDTNLRWNGADLLTRVAKKFSGQENNSIKQLELKVEPSYIFFPISSGNITRYFIAPATKTEKAQQDVLLEKILQESLTFHFWNSLTSSLIPEPDSLVARLMNHACIRCLELL
ncbi:hypothetical protein Lal_00007373 [Lupinus albus]|uniref:Putative glycosyltransferase, DXD sugar-binding, alpha 1,4-glycosyltransferase n=1 Tax=Lupinus albus TaxID=3870 RepID=A0A6A4NXX8_LUPAL|nr:putative glycosyltransferase, DXD sugar-binding, alpha 1,4-glycosyltransferase [Lupinus albus]KAF1874759.1 hypothetical protein Lal_00007373 [Lupinus albus]